MSRLSVIDDSVKFVAAANRLTEDDNGKVIFLNSTTAFATTLPPLRAGLRLTIVVKAVPSGTQHTVITHASANVIIGSASSADLNAASDADFEATGCDTINFVTAKTVKGDRVELLCDGVNWYADATSSLFDAITFTTTS